MALMNVALSVISSGIYLVPSAGFAFALMAIAAVGAGAINGPLLATIQTITPSPVRAQALSIIYFAANLVGMGLGPLAAGLISDSFHSWAGDESLRYALLALCPGYIWSGFHLWRASRSARAAEDASASSAPVDDPALSPQAP
jgi:MFS family permease